MLHDHLQSRAPWCRGSCIRLAVGRHGFNSVVECNQKYIKNGMNYLCIQEDGHEYGNPSTSWNPSNDAEAALSAAAYRWRRCLNKNRKNHERVGAFADWKVGIA